MKTERPIFWRDTLSKTGTRLVKQLNIYQVTKKRRNYRRLRNIYRHVRTKLFYLHFKKKENLVV